MKETGANPDGRSEAVSAGLDAYLEAEAAGASEERAFAAALGRAIERYLDSLDHESRVRLIVGLRSGGGPIPEEPQLPGDPRGRRRVLEAAARLAREGALRRVRSRTSGRVFWLPTRPGDEGPGG
ncbi:MAG: hypothetical protein M3R38_24570 [Actinomycetota bacterium]|nr:hypothetical protein [Actinomycetota bacterium]MDP9478817.1 hypothetical protein [Actinomycetota bacterium]